MTRIYDYMSELIQQQKHVEQIFQENLNLKRQVELLQFHHQSCQFLNTNDGLQKHFSDMQNNHHTS